MGRTDHVPQRTVCTRPGCWRTATGCKARVPQVGALSLPAGLWNSELMHLSNSRNMAFNP